VQRVALLHQPGQIPVEAARNDLRSTGVDQRGQQSAGASLRFIAVVRAVSPVHGALPDVIAIGRASDGAVATAIADAPERRPVVLAPRDAAGIDAAMRQRALPYVVGGRDFTVTADGSVMELSVGDERYSDLALAAGDDPELAATGIVMALAIAALGVRMRPEWVELGSRAAAARE